MEISQLAIGVVIGILIGAVLLWLLDRRHQKVIKNWLRVGARSSGSEPRR